MGVIREGLERVQRSGRIDTVGTVSRRTLTRSTAWAAPVLVTSVAAPASAASGPCAGGQAALNGSTLPVPLTFSPSTVTATVTFSSTGATGNDQTPGETGEIHATAYSPSWRYIKLHLPAGMDQGDTVTITLTFSQPVTGLSLTITDIDKDKDQWIDQVIVNTAGYAVAAKGANVTGAGTTGNPFTTSVNGGIDSAAGDVKLTWQGSLSQVQLTYRAADILNGSGIGQHIGVGLIGFASC